NEERLPATSTAVTVSRFEPGATATPVSVNWPFASAWADATTRSGADARVSWTVADASVLPAIVMVAPDPVVLQSPAGTVGGAVPRANVSGGLGASLGWPARSMVTAVTVYCFADSPLSRAVTLPSDVRNLPTTWSSSVISTTEDGATVVMTSTFVRLVSPSPGVPVSLCADNVSWGGAGGFAVSSTRENLGGAGRVAYWSAAMTVTACAPSGRGAP